MAEWGDLDARLERKKRIKLRRQQRDMKKQHMEMELLEKERRKLTLRCEEMAREEQLSIAMMQFYRQQETRRLREIQHQKDLQLYGEVAKMRTRAKRLGLPLVTPGLSGLERLNELQSRIESREASLQVAVQAKQRLDALPKKRSRVRSLLDAYFSSSVVKKVENVVFEQRCESLVELLEPKLSGQQVNPRLLNHESQNAMTPLLCTIFCKKLSILRRLLELGASTDFETSTGMTPLLASVMADDVVAMNILFEFRVNIGYESHGDVTAMLLAADMGRHALLKAMLRHGADVNAANVHGRTALAQAIISNQHESVKILLAFGASKDPVDKAGYSLLEWARRFGAAHITSLLVSSTTSQDLMAAIRDQEEQEADAPNALVAQVLRHQNKPAGTVAMEMALRNKEIDRILELLSLNDVGYGPNYETSAGETPLLVVAEKGTAQQVLSCLEHKCVASYANRFGTNALMKAAYRGDHGVLDLLIQAGCSAWSRDFRGNDTFRYLHENEHPDVVDWLTKKCKHRESPPLLTLGGHVENLATLRAFVISVTAQQPHNQETNNGQDDDDQDGPSPRENSEGDDDNDGHSHGDDDVEQAMEFAKTHKWSIRRRVLRHNKTRNQDFEGEREKIHEYAQHGRRNGLIAPLPSDPAGRFKFPSCENCQTRRARKKCFSCEQKLCDQCHARLHELPHRRHHALEELEPTLMVGATRADVIAANQRESLQGSVQRFMHCIDTIQQVLQVPASVVQQLRLRVEDPEVDKYERKQRLLREKEIAQMQINVPVAAARHAARTGESDIFTNPTELELADLYLTQNKLAKARQAMVDAKQVVDESLGYAHPTMLKILFRMAKIEQHDGDLEKSVAILETTLGTFESLLAPDHKDLIAAQELLLQVLDTLGRYQSAIDVCRRVARLRMVRLTASHPLVNYLRHQQDGFIAKREKHAMAKEDVRSLEQAALSTEQSDNLRGERERQLQAFRSLLLDQQPSDDYDAFLAYARKEFADDMVHFWIAVEKAKTTIDEHDAKSFRAAVVTIFLLFIKSRRIKLTTAVQRKKMKKAITTPGKKLPRNILDEVQVLVFDVIYGRVFPRFCEIKGPNG